tara:strand:- start:1631 stop:1843 length:213 start_codon:yes stop_codon:yes gene_type:complete
MKKFRKGEIVSYENSESPRKLGIVVSEPYISTTGWKIKTYCNGAFYNNSLASVRKVCDDVEIIKPNYPGY